MLWVTGLVAGLVILGSVLAIAESSISRMTRVRAIALRQEGRRNAAVLERIASDPPRYLNSIYLSVMFAQNGSAILVAIVTDHYFGTLGVTLVSVGFTLGYFVVVEAMSKTFGILHSDRAALAVAPMVWFLGRTLALPSRLLIGLANVLLPGKGLKQGPFVYEQDIRSMAEVGHEAGAIEEAEKELIHSVFHFGDMVVREMMVPRPDIVAIDVESSSLRDAHTLLVRHAFTRVPAYRGDLDRTEGIVHAKDILSALLEGRHDTRLAELLRPAHFVPESKRAAVLLHEMQQGKFHLAMVTDEYGSVAGLVTLEDLLEELVGEIAEEHEQEARDVEPLGEGRYRLDASLSIPELNQLLGTDLPRDSWNTLGGLMFGLLGTIPAQGQTVTSKGFRFTAERVHGRRVTRVLVEPVHPAPSSG